MIILNKKLPLLFIFCLFSFFPVHAEEFVSNQCEPLVENTSVAKDIKHSQGMLWKLEKPGVKTNYLYGTIHISDTEVTVLPNLVEQALLDSEHFVMEALPDVEEMMAFSKTMFFNDGQLLAMFLDAPVYERTKEILATYHLGHDAVSVMKPWAAFLMMNYPSDQGEVLDLVLLAMAQQNGASVAGLETMKEQAAIFNQLNLDDQAKLLTDTVCHYDIVKEDFSIMKTLYLDRDLGGLYRHANRYTMVLEPVYEKLLKNLIEDRNHTMAKRMQKVLDQGNAFVAIGAMHLTGEEGVLSLLEQQGYRVSAVY